MKYGYLYYTFFFILRLIFQMAVKKTLPDAIWLLVIDILVDGQVCPLSLGFTDKRRQLLVAHFRVNRRLILRYHTIVLHFRGLIKFQNFDSFGSCTNFLWSILFEYLKEIQISENIRALSVWSASAAFSSAEATFKNSKLNPPCILGALPKYSATTFSNPLSTHSIRYVRKCTSIIFYVCVAVQTIACDFCRPVLFLRFVYASNPHMPQVLASRLDLKRLRTQFATLRTF